MTTNNPIPIDVKIDEAWQATVATITQPKHHEGHGSKNPKWGKGPSLLQQRDFLNGVNRDEYNQQFVQR